MNIEIRVKTIHSLTEQESANTACIPHTPTPIIEMTKITAM
jgi:hypothetical protein